MRATPDLTDEALLLHLATELAQRGLELFGVLDQDFHFGLLTSLGSSAKPPAEGNFYP